MALTSADRVNAIYNGIVAANPASMSRLSPDEVATLKANLKAIWGDADLAYLKTSAAITAGTLANAQGQFVATGSGVLT